MEEKGGQRGDGRGEEWRETFFILILNTRGETPKNNTGEENMQDTKHASFL